jgi:hypothetical protein
MKSWEYLAAFIGLAAGLWGQVRMVMGWIKGLIIITVSVDETVANLVAAHLGKSRSVSQNRLFSGSTHTWVKPLGRVTTVVWEKLVGSSRTFWNGFRPVWYRKLDKPVSMDHPHSFSFIRGTLDWEKLLLQASDVAGGEASVAFKTKLKRHRVIYHFGKNLGSELAKNGNGGSAGNSSMEDPGAKATYSWGGTGVRLLGWSSEDIGQDDKFATFTSLSLSPELVSIVEELKRWSALKGWYAERGIPWKRGYLFQGAPGTGKTAFARAAAEELDFPVHVFDLATMSNTDLREEWNKMLKVTPCMVVLEDIDGIFHGRQNVSPGGSFFTSGGLTFDSLLNCVDGVERTDGVLLVVTTNHPEQVDPALYDRPGRIDRIVDFQPLDFEGRLKLATRILGEGDRSWRLASEGEGMPAAKFLEKCCREALEGLYDAPSAGPYR